MSDRELISTIFFHSEYIQKMWAFSIISFLLAVGMCLDIYLRKPND